MRPFYICVVVLVCLSLVSLVCADGAQTQTQTPSSPPPHQPQQAAAPPTPVPAAAAAAAAAAAFLAGPSASQLKIEADVNHLNQVVGQQAEKLRQVSEELGHIKVSASAAISSSSLDALKSDLKNSIDSFSKTADQNAKQFTDNVNSIRSSEESRVKQFKEFEAKLQKLEKLVAEENDKIERLLGSFQVFQTEVNDKLSQASASSSGFSFTFDWDTIWSTIVSKSKEYATKVCDLSVHLYERAIKELTAFSKESVPTREEAERLVKEWWENAQKFYFQTVEPNAINLYELARNQFDDAAILLTDFLVEKAAVPKDTAKIIALSFLSLISFVIAFVVIIIVLQILSFVLSIVFYFLCCRFCRSNKSKKNKKEKKGSVPPAVAATSTSASAAGNKSSSSVPPTVKKNDKGPKSPPPNKTQP